MAAAMVSSMFMSVLPILQAVVVDGAKVARALVGPAVKIVSVA